MGASVITFDTRCKDRFYGLAAETRLHATPDQRGTIDRLVAAVRLGHVTARDGRATMASLRQQQRDAA